MKAKLIPLRSNDLSCWSAFIRHAEQLILSSGNLIAEAHYDALSSRVDSTRITLQAASRIIHASHLSHNRGVAGDFLDFISSIDITPELTRYEREAFY
jgi:hypothetical protein